MHWTVINSEISFFTGLGLQGTIQWLSCRNCYPSGVPGFVFSAFFGYFVLRNLFFGCCRFCVHGFVLSQDFPSFVVLVTLLPLSFKQYMYT